MSRRFTSRLQFRTTPGFTIVELLIVIVIIGILATVTIVSYTGINNRAIAASMQSDLASASTKLKLYQTDNMAYPTLINSCPTPSAGNICLKASPGNTYSYSAVNSASPQTFRLTSTNTNGAIYVVKNNSSPAAPGPDIVLSQTFDYTGSLQTFTVPADVVSVTIECFGAKGGVNYVPYAGGAGGYAKGSLAVSPSDVLNLYVGGSGANYPSDIGGWNGGGNSTAGWGTGGGATDVRVGGTALANRVIVAGGGGGGGDYAIGGGGGGTAGGGAAAAGTQTTGYALGVGQPLGAAGGGGYWGGFGRNNMMPGGGGSGYTGGVTNPSMTIGTNASAGKIILTYSVPSS